VGVGAFILAWIGNIVFDGVAGVVCRWLQSELFVPVQKKEIDAGMNAQIDDDSYDGSGEGYAVVRGNVVVVGNEYSQKRS
jgi:hypothetical protein